jgi:hypothetical protein
MTEPEPFKIRLTLGRVMISIALGALCLKLYLRGFRMRVPEPLQGSWFRGTLSSFLTTAGMVQLLYWYEFPGRSITSARNVLESSKTHTNRKNPIRSEFRT